MQGREGQGDQWHKPSGQRLNGTGKHPSLNGTSKHPSIAAEIQATGRQPAVPQRPPGMARVEVLPSQPRIARPRRAPTRPGARKRRFLLFGCLLVICAGLAFGLTYIVIMFSQGLNASNGAATTANDFLTALSQSNYTQAYSDLRSPITLNTSQDDFMRQVQRLDGCYGPVKSFSEIPNSATIQGNSQSYAYTIIRSKYTKPYQVRLTLQFDQDSNAWRISDYGTDLGPSQGAPSCQ